MNELQAIIVFHGRHFVRHLGICNPIRVKLLQIMSGVIPRNLKTGRLYLKPYVYLASTKAAYTQTGRHTDTHDDIVAFRLKMMVEQVVVC